MTGHLYRHFNSQGALLYVGSARCALRRLDTHRAGCSPWFDQIARIEIERFPSIADAREAVRKAIAEEQPLYNVPYNALGRVAPYSQCREVRSLEAAAQQAKAAA